MMLHFQDNLLKTVRLSVNMCPENFSRQLAHQHHTICHLNNYKPFHRNHKHNQTEPEQIAALLQHTFKQTRVSHYLLPFTLFYFINLTI